MPHLVLAECPDHRGRETEGDGLQHQAFGRMPRLHVDVAASAIAILGRRSLKNRGDADHCRRGGDPFLTARGIDQLFALMTGGYEQQFVVRWMIAIHTAGERADAAANGIELQRIERACG